MLTLEEIHSVIASDQNCNDFLENDYSDIFHETIRSNWLQTMMHIIMIQNLICNNVNFRLAKYRSETNIKDYFPTIIKYHMCIVGFLQSVLFRYFIERRIPVYVNCSMNFIIYDENEDGSTFCYGSNNNFQLFESAYLIRNDSTFSSFCNDFLPSYNLMDYLEAVVNAISEKYDGLIIPLS